jgi:hypothetical protein
VGVRSLGAQARRAFVLTAAILRPLMEAADQPDAGNAESGSALGVSGRSVRRG